jgi:hypothetical protein
MPTESISISLFLSNFCYFYKLLQFLTHQSHCLLVEAFSNCRSHCKWSSCKSRAQMITFSVIVLWFMFEPSFCFAFPIILYGSNRDTQMILRLMSHSHLYSLPPLDHIFFSPAPVSPHLNICDLFPYLHRILTNVTASGSTSFPWLSLSSGPLILPSWTPPLLCSQCGAWYPPEPPPSPHREEKKGHMGALPLRCMSHCPMYTQSFCISGWASLCFSCPLGTPLQNQPPKVDVSQIRRLFTFPI